MEGQSGLPELSIISWVSAVEGCLLSEVPLYTDWHYFVPLADPYLEMRVELVPTVVLAYHLFV